MKENILDIIHEEQIKDLIDIRLRIKALSEMHDYYKKIFLKSYKSLSLEDKKYIENKCKRNHLFYGVTLKCCSTRGEVNKYDKRS